MSVDTGEILRLLGPRAGTDLIWDICLYCIFLFMTIFMFLQPPNTIGTTLISGGVIAMTIIDKLQIFAPKDLATFLFHTGMFALPALMTGMTRAPKSRPWSVFAFIVGGLYLFGFWFVVQRG